MQSAIKVYESKRDQPITRTIFVPIDKSEHSKKAIKWVLDTLYQPGDQILVVHVRHEAQQSLVPSPTFGYEQILDQMNTAFIEESRQLLLTQAQHLSVPVEAISIPGDPRIALVKEITDRMPKMVVMGQRGTGPLSRAIMGSVSDYLVKHSPTPVIIIK